MPASGAWGTTRSDASVCVQCAPVTVSPAPPVASCAARAPAGLPSNTWRAAWGARLAYPLYKTRPRARLTALHWHWDRARTSLPGAMASLARVCSLLLVGVAVVLLLPGTHGSYSNCPPSAPGHGGGGGGDPGHHHPPHHGKPPKHHHGPPSGPKCPPCHPPPTPRPPPTPPYGPPTPLPPPYMPPTPRPPPYTPPTLPYIPPSPPYMPPTPLPPPYVPPYVPPTPPYTPPYMPPTPPYVPPSPPYVPPTPPYTPPYVPPTPPYVPPPSPGPGRRTCPIDALKLNACVDVLSGLVHLVIGREARSKCCPLVQGVADLDAALCLCTTIRARVLNINIYLPVALRLLITCGKHPPNGFQCPTVLDA